MCISGHGLWKWVRSHCPLEVPVGVIIGASVWKNVIAPLAILGGVLALVPLWIYLEQVISRGSFAYTKSFCGNPLTRTLVRLTHRAHRHYSLDSCIDNQAPRCRLGRGMIRRSYQAQDLANDFVAFCALRKQQGLEDRQREALTRWQDLSLFKLGSNVRENPLDLKAFLTIFDDLFFLGALGQYTDIDWIKRYQYRHHLLGRASLGSDMNLGFGCDFVWSWLPQRVSIDIVEIPLKPKQVWTKKLIGKTLGVLLHEMAHAFVMLYSCPVLGFMSWQETAKAGGLTGHGPAWQDVALAIEGAAAELLEDQLKKWYLVIDYSKAREANRVRNYVEAGWFKMSDEELENLKGFTDGLNVWKPHRRDHDKSTSANRIECTEWDEDSTDESRNHGSSVEQMV